MSASVQLISQENERTIILNNPERHNSLGEVELEQLHCILDALVEDQTVRVVKIGATPCGTFCAGASLSDLREGRISGSDFQSVTDRIAELDMPTIAVLNGNVYGGGAELALSCDFRMAARGIHLRVPAAEIGLCYPFNGIVRYVERLGTGAAKRILLAAERFDSEQLLTIGFLDWVVDAAELDGQADKLSTDLARLAPLAVQSMKKLIRQAEGGGVDPILAEALADRCTNSQDLVEGLSAQREKRLPDFKGV